MLVNGIDPLSWHGAGPAKYLRIRLVGLQNAVFWPLKGSFALKNMLLRKRLFSKRSCAKPFFRYEASL